VSDSVRVICLGLRVLTGNAIYSMFTHSLPDSVVSANTIDTFYIRFARQILVWSGN